MKAAEKCLLLAIRNQLRAAPASFANSECEVEFDEMSPGTVSGTYLAVMPGGWVAGPRHKSSGLVNDLVYGADILVVKRIAHVPRDRRRDVFLKNLDSLDAEIDKVYAAIDFNYSLLAAANLLIKNETTSTEGFTEPLKFVGVDRRPRLAPAELFAAKPGEQAAGLIRVVSFHGARRITSR